MGKVPNLAKVQRGRAVRLLPGKEGARGRIESKGEGHQLGLASAFCLRGLVDYRINIPFLLFGTLAQTLLLTRTVGHSLMLKYARAENAQTRGHRLQRAVCARGSDSVYWN